MASIASPIGVALNPTQGSCLPFVTISVASPLLSMVSAGFIILDGKALVQIGIYKKNQKYYNSKEYNRGKYLKSIFQQTIRNLKSLQLPRNINAKSTEEYYIAMSHICRTFIKEEYFIRATEMTTRELKLYFEMIGIKQELIINWCQLNKIVDLDYGNNIFQIEAQNNDGSNLNTTKSVTITYLSFDDITGHWKGETITRPFSFDIYQLVNQYVIDGTLTIDLTFMGGPLIIEDIIVFGLINSDGTINAELSKTADDMSISGLLVGSFSTSGVAGGNYTLTIELLGTSLAHTEEWTAEKQ